MTKTITARMVVVFSHFGKLTHGVRMDSDHTFCGLEADSLQLDRSGSAPSCFRCQRAIARLVSQDLSQ
jgi:hypothetical protein